MKDLFRLPGLNMKANIKATLSTAAENTLIPMATFTTASGMRARGTAKGYTATKKPAGCKFRDVCQIDINCRVLHVLLQGFCYSTNTKPVESISKSLPSSEIVQRDVRNSHKPWMHTFDGHFKIIIFFQNCF